MLKLFIPDVLPKQQPEVCSSWLHTS